MTSHLAAPRSRKLFRPEAIVAAEVVDPVNALILWPGDVSVYRAPGAGAPSAYHPGAGGTETERTTLVDPLAAGSSQPLVVPLPALAGRDQRLDRAGRP